jgi:hypothetical protein
MNGWCISMEVSQQVPLSEAGKETMDEALQLLTTAAVIQNMLPKEHRCRKHVYWYRLEIAQVQYELGSSCTLHSSNNIRASNEEIIESIESAAQHCIHMGK